MYAIIDYKGSQILLKEGCKVRVPFLKDAKVGSILTFDNVLFFDNGKKKQAGSPYIKNMNLKAKIVSHERDTKILVFKQKRRKGHQKKNGYRDNYTLIQVDKLSTAKAKKPSASTLKKVTKKSTTSSKTSKLTKK